MADVERMASSRRELSHTVVGEILVRKWGLGDELANVVLLGVHHRRPPSRIPAPFTFLVGMADIIGQAIVSIP